MQAAERIRATEAEYLERERASADKHEFINGEIVAMAGASPKHNLIAMNIGAALLVRLRGRPCFVFNSDQRTHVEATGLYSYPDVTVTCERPRFHPNHPDNLLNPKVIIEVLSPSTERYDRGPKFAHYQHLSSLTEYVLVSQDERRVDHYRRLEPGQWLLTVYEVDAAVVAFPTLACEVPMAEIYENADRLDEPPPPRTEG